MTPVRRLFLVGAAAVLAAACGGPMGQTMPDLKLPELSGKRAPSLASCSRPKCLTVYVAPWCGYGRHYTPHIIALRKFLDGKGIPSRVIVGSDSPAAVREYAKTFGEDALLDPAGEMNPGGVPHFYVSDAGGRVL